MNKKILLIMLVGIVLIGLVSVSATQQNLGTFKRGDCIPLSQTCGNCTYNNVTSILKTGENSLVHYLNVSMTKNDIYYNYSYCNISEIGIYHVHGFGDPDGEMTSWIYPFTVTVTGVDQQSIFKNPILIIFLIVFAIFFLIAYQTEIPWLGFVSSIPLMMAGMYTMIYGFNDVTNLYTRALSLVVLGVGLVIMIISSYDWWMKAEGGE